MDFTPFAEHLAYLGYSTNTESQETLDIMYAEAVGKPNINLSKFKNLNFLLARSNWNILNKSEDIDTFINELNGRSVNVSSVWHYTAPNGNEALGISGAYFGDYDKKNFAIFIDSFLADINRVITSSEGQKLLNSVTPTIPATPVIPATGG